MLAISFEVLEYVTPFIAMIGMPRPWSRLSGDLKFWKQDVYLLLVWQGELGGKWKTSQGLNFFFNFVFLSLPLSLIDCFLVDSSKMIQANKTFIIDNYSNQIWWEKGE